MMNEKWTMEDKKRRMGIETRIRNEEWEMENEEQGIGYGEWGIENNE